MNIRIDALGDLRVFIDGAGSPELRGMRSRLALLIYLAIERDLSRDMLKATLWPESDTTTARHALRQALYHIRGVVGDDWVELAGGMLHATPSLSSDVLDFDSAVAAGEWEKAAALYQGPFLESIHLVSNHSWDAWVGKRRLALTRLYRQACRQWVDERLAAEDMEGALQAARIWVRPDPLDDEAQHRVIELLAVSGRRFEAIEQYDVYSRLLEAESLQPLEDTVRLAEAIRRGEVPPGTDVPRSESVDDDVSVTPAADSTADGRELPVAPATSRRRRWVQPVDRTGGLAGRVARGAGLVASIAAVAAVGVIGASQPWNQPDLEEGRTITVPFDNLTGDPDLNGIGVLAADWITQSLVYSGVIEVVSTDDMFRARIDVSADGEPTEDVVDPLRVARSAHASTAVTGSYFVQNDTIVFEARVLNVSTGRVVRAIDGPRYPVDDVALAVNALRDRIVGAMATLTDARMKQWSDRASQPPDYRAYRHYAMGLDYFLAGSNMDRADLAERDSLRSQALDHFLTAADVDSTFTAALIWAWFAAVGLPRQVLDACRDSGRCAILPRIQAVWDRLPPWDRAMAEWIHMGPLDGPERGYPGRLEAGRKVARYAPDSEWLYKLAYAAQPLNRPYEALEALDRIDPEQGWVRRWPAYWTLMAMVLHQVGPHERELEVVRKLDTFQPDRAWRYMSDALAATGRTDELVERVGDLIGSAPPTLIAVSDVNRTIRELRLHGSDETADQIAVSALQWAAHADLDEPGREYVGGQMHVRDELARLMIETGAYDQAVSLMMPVVFQRTVYPPWQFAATLGIAAAWAGDQALAKRCIALLEESSQALGDPRHHLGQAEILAAQGDADAALERITLMLDQKADLAEAGGLDDRWVDSGWRWTPGGRDHWLNLLFHPNRIAVLLQDEPRFRKLVEPRG